MITEDRVTFEIAKLLRDKGFPQNTFEIDCNVCYKYNGKLCNNAKSMSGVDREISYMAPTLQMVRKWLREVHNIDITITPDRKEGYTAMIFVNRELPFTEIGSFKTYEAACEAAIKYALENLI